MKVVVDSNLCDGYGTCERVAKELFKLHDEGVAHVIVEGDLSPEQIESAQAAINVCPVNAISFETDEKYLDEIQPTLDMKGNQISDLVTPFETHVFVCTSGEYCPEKDGNSKEVHKKFKELVKQAGLKGRVRVNNSGCLDQCGHGPMVVVYPAGVWYSHLTVEDVSRIVDEHLVKGCPVESLRYHPQKAGGNKLERDVNDLRIGGQLDGCRADWPTIPVTDNPEKD
jgi:(2Fe-2S) ferredoxin/ferredoxin